MGDGEGGDLTHPTGSTLAEEEVEGVRGEDERDSLMGGQGVKVGPETVSV